MCNEKFQTSSDPAWCPGCGDFAILECLKEALTRLELPPYKVMLTAGIGQAAKTPQYLNANGFCGLHGRSLPPAAAAKIANKDLTVIVNTGDGDSYGEGGNHFLHNIRRNVDITHFVHDNQIYGLTKGQASPTTELGFVTGVQTMGSVNNPINPLLLAISAGAGFVARSFSGDKEHLIKTMMEAIQFKGYALVDILQPCISFNKVNTFQWYSKRVYKLDEAYDNTNKLAALEKALEWGDKIPLGVIFKEEKDSYIDRVPHLRNKVPMVDWKPDLAKVKEYMEELA